MLTERLSEKIRNIKCYKGNWNKERNTVNSAVYWGMLADC
jgi:hypothetical protein